MWNAYKIYFSFRVLEKATLIFFKAWLCGGQHQRIWNQTPMRGNHGLVLLRHQRVCSSPEALNSWVLVLSMLWASLQQPVADCETTLKSFHLDRMEAEEYNRRGNNVFHLSWLIVVECCFVSLLFSSNCVLFPVYCGFLCLFIFIHCRKR